MFKKANLSPYFMNIALFLCKQRASQAIRLGPIILTIVSNYLSETLSSLINP
jgi:hypothetical protein